MPTGTATSQADTGDKKRLRATAPQAVGVYGFCQTLFPVCGEADARGKLPT